MTSPLCGRGRPEGTGEGDFWRTLMLKKSQKLLRTNQMDTESRPGHRYTFWNNDVLSNLEKKY